MKKGTIEVICGHGRGKTALAIGKGLEAAAEQQTVIMIQFLKGCVRGEEKKIMENLEPGFKIFRFEKADAFFEELTGEEKAEELDNILNGFHFAKKVVATGECDLLILDEVLGLVNQNIVSIEEFENLLKARDDGMSLLLTGMEFPRRLAPYVDEFFTIQTYEPHVAVDKDVE